MLCSLSGKAAESVAIVKSITSDSNKDINMKRYLAVIRRPIFFVVINFFLVNTLFSLLPFSIGNIVYNIGRIAIIFYAGWFIIKRKVGGIWQSALAGTLIYFIDHVVLKGGIFLLNYLFKPAGLGLAAFGGVLVSFIMFVPLAILIGAMGGLVARSKREGNTANSQ
jgi:hypothetical protein